jgi:hypothetical protein
MNETKSGLIVFAIAMIPYVAVAWGYAHFTDGGSNGFWVALGVLLAIRFFFSVIETIGNVLVWRLYGRHRTIEKLVDFFRANEFPPKEIATDDLGNYLARIVAFYQPKPDYRRAASEFESLELAAENAGILAGMRFHAAAEAAFKIYIPTAGVDSGSQDN